MKSIYIYPLALFVHIFSTNVLAATIPHTFVSGTSAKASEVNSNFNSLANTAGQQAIDIDTNAVNIDIINSSIAELISRIEALEARAAPPVAIDGNGDVIGAALGYYPMASEGHEQSPRMEVMTDEGYTLFVSTNGIVGVGVVSDIHYLTSDCTGQAYVDIRSGVGHVSSRAGLYPNLGYVPLEATYVDIFALSWLDQGGSCAVLSTQLATTRLPYNLNDPIITGVPSLYVGPISIRR
jgi:hypothetical protein